MAENLALSVDQIGLSSDIVVSNAAELRAAIVDVPDGATIRLLAGNYDTLTLSRFSKDLTIVADRDAPAVLNSMTLTNVQGLTLDGIVFDFVPTENGAHWDTAFGIFSSQNITIRNALFDGGDAFGTGTFADGYGTGTGLGIGGSTGITLEDSEITGFWKGLRMGQSIDVVIRGNDFNDMRSDAIAMGSMHDTIVENNHFHDMRAAPGSGDHNDMLQVINTHNDEASTGLTVRGNVFNIAAGTGTQTIFLTNNAARDGGGPETFYRDFLIEDNLIVNGHRNALVVGETDGLVVRNNTVLRADPLVETTYGDSLPVISVNPESRNVTIADNVTTGLSGPAGQADWTVAGNIIVQKDNPAADNHYSAHFIDPVGDFTLDLAKLTVRPDSVIAQQGAGASKLLYTGTNDSLTPRIVSEQQVDNRAVYVFDAGMTTDPDGPVDASMADFLWTFSDGTTARGVRVEHQFAAPGTHTAALTVTIPDGTQASTETIATIRNSTVMSFDTASGTLVMHGADGLQTLADAPLVEHPNMSGQLLDLSALDTVIKLPPSLLTPMHEAGRMEIDMRIAGLPGNNGAGEIMRQHEAFGVSVKDGEIIFALNQAEGGWTGVKSSGAQLGSGMWRDVKLVHDTATARAEIWIDGNLNAATDGVGTMQVNNREVTLGGPFSRTAFDGALEWFELRTNPDGYDFAAPVPQPVPGTDPTGIPVPEDAAAPLPAQDETRLERPDLDTLRAEIEAGTSDLSLREATPDNVNVWADHGGSLLIGGDDNWERFRDRTGDDVMNGGTGADQFVFDMRHMQVAQTDRILDLDFGEGDVLRFLRGDSAPQLWFSSAIDINKAVENNLVTAEVNADGSALELRLTTLPQHLVELDLRDGFTWQDMS